LDWYFYFIYNYKKNYPATVNVLPKMGKGAGPGGNPRRFQTKFQKARSIGTSRVNKIGIIYFLFFSFRLSIISHQF
jgi:hypothetical protein